MQQQHVPLVWAVPLNFFSAKREGTVTGRQTLKPREAHTQPQGPKQTAFVLSTLQFPHQQIRSKNSREHPDPFSAEKGTWFLVVPKRSPLGDVTYCTRGKVPALQFSFCFAAVRN